MSPELTRVGTQIPGQWISHAHTAAAYAAFFGAFIVGVALHYEKIVQNEHFGYPIEWFPSVSATIGDRYPERAVFQVFIAICSGPRFLLVFLFYCLVNRKGESGAKWVAGVGVFRTLTCGGWTYVTSTDDHDWHDIFMISYLVATLPWTIGCLMMSPPNPKTIQLRKYLASAFFGTIVPLVYFFIQHKVHRVPGGEKSFTGSLAGHRKLIFNQHTPLTPSSNGPSFSWTSPSMRSLRSISAPSKSLSRT